MGKLEAWSEWGGRDREAGSALRRLLILGGACKL